MVYLNKSGDFLVLPNPENQEKETNKYIFIKQNSSYKRLTYSDLVLVMSSGNYVELLTFTQKKFILKSSILQITNDLNYEKMIRIHRSYLINIDHIIEFSLQDVTLSNGCVLPIGKNFQENFLQAVLKISISA
ncbi:LytR/AlgR family response regulator transcription factor [Flectobacillus longus]|uniref:LytR/AlgR family response regulator transcription factor n=1 Tax=Flectobacillus longus TaxID=2984207 RepID=UPI0024B69314|nr:LytTR family DNA-binding domain-containing protein [Flectobacillus longus]MDI9882396.1 LytTR family DNA-binding domain-containing protein [Flectobacillus longus]